MRSYYFCGRHFHQGQSEAKHIEVSRVLFFQVPTRLAKFGAVGVRQVELLLADRINVLDSDVTNLYFSVVGVYVD